MKLISKLDDVKISWKLPILIVALSVLAASVTALFGYLGARHSVIAEAENKLLTAAEARALAVGHWLKAIEDDLEIQTVNPAVIDAIDRFAIAWDRIEGDRTAYLQKWYITDNPHPTGAKDNLTVAEDGSLYSNVHKSFHPYFHKLQKDRGYYDVFLFDTNGNLVYSVFKELDYATNIVTGQWAGSDLGAAFRAARDARGAAVFTDFKPYAPSNGAAASFIAQAVMNKAGRVAGVVAFQMPIGGLNGLMQENTGLGETGQTYLVGADKLMRNDSLMTEGDDLLSVSRDTEAVAKGLNGEQGYVETVDISGAPSYAAYSSVAFKGATWAVVAEQSASEMLAPVVALRNEMLLELLLAALGTAVIGFLVARSISRPLDAVGQAMVRVGQREYGLTVPAIDRGDEVGQIARTLETFRGDLCAAEEASRVALFKSAAFEGRRSR